MIRGTFKTKDNKTCRVELNCSAEIEIGQTDGYFFGENPVQIQVDNEDTFEHIIKTTCRINLVTSHFIPELFSANDREISARIYLNNRLIFSGFVQPLCYNQPYADHLSTLTIQCQDYLCTLTNHKYKDNFLYSLLVSLQTNISFYDIICNILPKNKLQFKMDNFGVFSGSSQSLNVIPADYSMMYSNVLQEINVPSPIYFVLPPGKQLTMEYREYLGHSAFIIPVGTTLIWDNDFLNMNIVIENEVWFWKIGVIYNYSSSSEFKPVDFLQNLQINESLFLGEEKDDWFSEEESLDVVLKYLNLHIIQEGEYFKIFHYNDKKSGSWSLDNRLPNSQQENSDPVNITADFYKDTDTQVTISDVYNQFIVKCSLDDEETIIKNPLDMESLKSPYSNFNLLCREWEDDKVDQIRNWYYLFCYNENWKLSYYNDITSQGNIEVRYTDSLVQFMKGNAVFLTEILKELLLHPLVPMFMKLGSVQTSNLSDDSPLTAPAMKQYLVISVNGNQKNDSQTSNYIMAIWDNIVKQTNGIIQYNSGSNMSTLTPSDSSVTNYIVISGKILLSPAMLRAGYSSSLYSKKFTWTDKKGINDSEIPSFNYEQFWDTTKYQFDSLNGVLSGGTIIDLPGTNYFVGQYSTIPSDLHIQWSDRAIKPLEQGPFREASLNDGEYANLIPPLDYEFVKKQFSEKYGEWFEVRNKNDMDLTGTVPILLCQLKIGDKYLVETGKNQYAWLQGNGTTDSESGIQNVTYNGQTMTATFSVGINPKLGDLLLNTEFDIAGNMNFKQGLHIPIKSTDDLSGPVEFKIIRPYYACWEQEIRKHPTMFRHTSWYKTEIPLMEYVQNIFISDFSVKVESDNGEVNNIEERDLVYMSEVNEKSIKEPEEISFKIATGLTFAESKEKGINTLPKKNNVFDKAGKPVTMIKRNDIPEYTKPEEFYIVDYFNEYSVPKIMVQTSLVADRISFWDRVMFDYFGDKIFHPLGYNYDIKNNKKQYTFKEI